MDVPEGFWVMLGQDEGWVKLMFETINHSDSGNFAPSVAASSSRARRLDTEEFYGPASPGLSCLF